MTTLPVRRAAGHPFVIQHGIGAAAHFLFRAALDSKSSSAAMIALSRRSAWAGLPCGDTLQTANLRSLLSSGSACLYQIARPRVLSE